MAKALKFYKALHQFMEERYKQTGVDKKIIVQVGSATCEKAAGSEIIYDEFRKLIRASGREDILLKQTGCTGRCAVEPIVGVFVPDQIPVKYEQVTASKVQSIFHDHIVEGEPVVKYILDKKTENKYDYVIIICSSSNCGPPTADEIEQEIKSIIERKGGDPGIVSAYSGGCMGLCSSSGEETSCVMMVFPEKTVYRFKDTDQLEEIVESHILKKKVASEYETHPDFITEHFLSLYGDVAFFNKQTRLTLRNSGLIDPESLTDYVMNRGYEALARILNKNHPPDVIEEITKSGLRGRGGGGFSTGQKWKNAVTYTNDPIKYVVCNADEGDPGAFMDRSAIEGDPFIILEGMTIGAFAIGASKGYIYVRAEYPLAIERFEKSIKIAQENNLLGQNIMNSGFDFDIEIRLGAGAFVCGEETALMYSIEGKRGQPRIRPPYPTMSGLWGHPTVINNVETWANIPTIMLYGAEWYSKIGTPGSNGTKVFALTGKVKNTGLIEVPMGTTLNEIIFDIGGGLEEGRELKAVQTGGPSGGCIPADKLDTRVDYQSLIEAGSMMGSGGMIVLDDADCMVSTAKFFLEFTQNESCGKCVPCREGTLRMYEIMQKITDGKGEEGDIAKLERLGNMIKKTSLCGLGQTAPNPVLSALKNFREEFEQHVHDKKCKALKCEKLIMYMIEEETCTGCMLCARRCPVACIHGEKRELHVIDQEECIKCGECFHVCKFDAVSII